jgi:hypothetical protein
MFGLKKKANQPLNQLPYEVYQTVHETDPRRRQWFIKLGAALVVVTLFVLGGIQFYHLIQNGRDDPKPSAGNASSSNSSNGTSNGSGSNAGSGNTAENSANNSAGQNNQSASAATLGSVTQSPQQNAPLPASGSTPDNGVQANNSSNNTTVRKPD